MKSVAPAPLPTQTICHRAHDWENIGEDLMLKHYNETNTENIHPLGRHLSTKGRAAYRNVGDDAVFSETLTTADAQDVRDSAKRCGADEMKGPSR
jgi:hypothetical protein